jgi:hypothetical protein
MQSSAFEEALPSRGQLRHDRLSGLPELASDQDLGDLRADLDVGAHKLSPVDSLQTQRACVFLAELPSN